MAEERNYVKYTFVKVDPAWRRRTAAERAADKREFAAACREFGDEHFLRTYSLVGTRGDCDLMVRAIARRLEPIHELHVLLNQSGLMRYAEMSHSYLAMTKESPYSRRARPARRAAPRGRLEVPHRLPDVEEAGVVRAGRRRSAARIMRDHIAVARRFPGIETNTAYSFGLDDQEFVVAFDADDPSEFLDLVQELRATESSAYTESETPIFTCISASPERALDALDGEAVGALPALAAWPTRSRAGLEQLLEAAELHARAALRLAGGPLGAVDRLPAGVGHVVRPALGEQLLERVAVRIRGLGRRPASRSSSSTSTVSWASRLLVPMIPVGPRLIQPVTYSPGSGAPVVVTRARARSGSRRARSSKGRSSSGTPR